MTEADIHALVVVVRRQHCPGGGKWTAATSAGRPSLHSCAVAGQASSFRKSRRRVQHTHPGGGVRVLMVRTHGDVTARAVSISKENQQQQQQKIWDSLHSKRCPRPNERGTWDGKKKNHRAVASSTFQSPGKENGASRLHNSLRFLTRKTKRPGSPPKSRHYADRLLPASAVVVVVVFLLFRFGGSSFLSLLAGVSSSKPCASFGSFHFDHFLKAIYTSLFR